MKVTQFNSLEDMFACLQADRIGADLRREPWQKETKPGDFLLRIEAGLVIWIELLDPVAGEKECGASDEEVEYVRELYAAPHMQGYRSTRSYSVIVPEGELGDVHVSTLLCRISKAQFEYAKAAGWDPMCVRPMLKLEETVPPRQTFAPWWFK